ncbi:MAG: YfcE family phosphodiesterase [Candidatus Zixiibacteriota bacterium]|nr:MAG: YfcE family phosphodiesterase [candidate division Zixibacteria bacterium]
MVAVSDTHIRARDPGLPGPLVEILRTADHIIHAGDYVCMEVLEYLRSLADTTAVSGNMDPPDIIKNLPRKAAVTLQEHRIGLIHGHQAHELKLVHGGPDDDYQSPSMLPFYKYLEAEFPDCKAIIFGHFHVPGVVEWSDRLLINPGSITAYGGRGSCAMLSLDAGKLDAEIIYF